MQVFIRIGANVELSEEDLRALANGDNSPLRSALDNGLVEFGGDTYIPQSALEDADAPADLCEGGDIAIDL